MDLIVFRKTKSIQKLVLSSLMWIKEDEFLLVTKKGSTKGLRRWPFTLKLLVLLELSSSTTPFECTW